MLDVSDDPTFRQSDLRPTVAGSASIRLQGTHVDGASSFMTGRLAWWTRQL